MAESNYTLKLTLAETIVIRMALEEKLEKMETTIKNIMGEGNAPPKDTIGLMDNMRRLLQRI